MEKADNISDIRWKNRLDCPICYGVFSDRKPSTPHLLQCGHTFCHTCLCKIKKESVIECPLDRELTPVMHDDVSSLMKNYALINVNSDGEQTETEVKIGDSTSALYTDHTDDVESQSDNQHAYLCGSASLTGCKPSSEHQSRAIYAIGLMILTGNLFLDWFVNDHVDKLVLMLALGIMPTNSPVSDSLKEVHHIGLDWYAIKIVFLVFAIFTTVSFILQFLGTMLVWCFSNSNKMVLQKLLVWTSLFLNDLPQCILTAIILYATDDAFLPYLGSTMLGVLGQYLIFYALCKTEEFHYPKVICCHAFLTAICFVIQIAHITKAYIV